MPKHWRAVNIPEVLHERLKGEAEVLSASRGPITASRLIADILFSWLERQPDLNSHVTSKSAPRVSHVTQKPPETEEDYFALLYAVDQAQRAAPKGSDEVAGHQAEYERIFREIMAATSKSEDAVEAAYDSFYTKMQTRAKGTPLSHVSTSPVL